MSKRQFDERQCRRIRQMADNNVSQMDIAKAYDVNVMVINRVINRRGAYADDSVD